MILDLTDHSDNVRVHLGVPMDACFPQAQPAVPLQASVLSAPPSLDLDRHWNCRYVGCFFHIQLHLPLQPDKAAVVTGTYRSLHRPDPRAQVTHLDEHLHRYLHLRLTNQICLETTDEEHGEDRGHIMFRSGRSVRIPPFRSTVSRFE